MLTEQKENIGGQGLNFHDNNENHSRNEKNKLLVETIILDDLIPYLPSQDLNKTNKYQKAIMKIDIEGFESHLFEHAHKFFDYVNVQVIFMEWVHVKVQTNVTRIQCMLDFLYERKFIAFGEKNKLDKKEWKNWFFIDIIWIKQD